MTEQTGMLMIIGVCAGVLLIGAARHKAEWLLNFVLRSVFGALAILLINTGIVRLGMGGGIGLNFVTVLTCGILGFPGLAALFGVYFSKSL